MEIPFTVHDALRLYAEFQGEPLESKNIRKLISTLKIYVLPSFDFSIPSLTKPIVCLKKVCLTKFINNAEQIFTLNYDNALKLCKNRASLENDKSNLNRFLKWMKKQNWHSIVANRREKPRSTPMQRTGQALSTVRRGQRRLFNANRYRLPISLISSKLSKQLNQLRTFAIAPVDPDGYRQDKPMRTITFDDRYLHYILRFFGWLVKYEIPDLAEKKLEAVKGTASFSDEDFQREQRFFKRPLETLELESLIDFKNLIENGASFENAALALDKELFNLDLAIMEDLRLLKKFIAWGVNTQKNSQVWGRQVCDTAILILKKNHGSKSKRLKYTDIDLIGEIRLYRNTIMQDYVPKTKVTKDEKILSPEQMEAIIDYRWQCTATQYSKATKRSSRAIIWSWQKFLIILFLHHYPIRGREIREMEWGKTLKVGTMRDGRRAYYCEMDEAQTKTGTSKKWYLDPDVFNDVFDEWLNYWRPKAEVSHQLIFFTHGSNLYPDSKGTQLSVSSLHSLVSSTIYSACRDLKTAAYSELEKLMGQERSEIEARQFLSHTSKLFIDIEPKRTNPHFLRHLGSTEIRRFNATPAQVKAFHKIIGNSEAEGEKSYSMLEPEEKTEQAISWRKITKSKS